MLATRHGKAEVIAPALASLGLAVVATDAVDTDRFGTFTGTVARAGTMREAARAKAIAGLAAMPGAEFAIASEGAFGPHPQAPFATADLELVLLRDRAGTFEVVVEHLALEARAVSRVVRTWPEAEAAASAAGFPAHALVVRDGAEPSVAAPPRAMLVREPHDLARHVAAALAAAGAAVVANDLRAHANPTRLAVIRAAAEALARRLAATCPDCGRPGWHGRALPGLRCAACGEETALPAADLFACDGCGHERRVPREGAADPARCPRCNP